MLNRKRLFIQAVSMAFGCFGMSAANAQNSGCYTVESLQGTYSVIGTYGAKTAIALGVRYFEGNGNMTGTFVLNQPLAGSTTGERTTTSGTQQGTYTVNCNGTGVVTRLTTTVDGTTVAGFDDLLIVEAAEIDGKLIATRMADAQRTPSGLVPGGIFLTRAYTLRPNDPKKCYTLESLQGWYGVVVNYDANLALGLQPEWLDGKGNLSRTGVNNQPVAGSLTGDRSVGDVTSSGTYTVNCDGTGAITRVVTRPDGTTATAVDDFLVIEAAEKDGQLTASTILDAQRGPAVVGSVTAFVTRTHTLRPNATAQWANRLQFLTCGTAPPTPSCQATVSVWNYYLTNRIDSNAPVLIRGDGTVMLTVQQYLDARIAAGL